ncbi:MAG: permease [Proteobacteria bacterium]|nr:permease [Pseudomonadota bacterium]
MFYGQLIEGIGKTNLLILSTLLAIGIIVPEQFVGSLRFTGNSLVSIAPFILLSVLMAAYLQAADADKMLGRVFSGHPVLVIFAASIFGALSPFCSCGVIPLISALLMSGVPLAGVMAFWISSPVMDPEMFILTAGELGVEFAVAKTLATISVGLIAGFSTYLLTNMGALKDPLRSNQTSGCGTNKINAPVKPSWKFWSEPERMTKFFGSTKKTGLFLGQWLLFAFLLESLMVVYMPANKISQWIPMDSLLIIPMAALVGVPTYLNGYAAIPLAGGLMESGFGAGSVLTFLSAGAMTSIPAAVAVYSLVTKNVFFLYITLALVGSILVGVAYHFYLQLGF